MPGILCSRWFRLCYNAYRDISLFRARERIAQLFNDHPEVHFVYKAFISLGNDPTLEMLSTACPRSIVIRDIPLTDLQWAADALIQEIPSSSMVEGMLTDKPMIVYANRDAYRLNPEAKRMIRNRAVLAETPDEFVQSVECLLNQGDYTHLTNPDTEYLRTYATYLDDGQSASRVADAIYKIMTGQPLELEDGAGAKANASVVPR